MSAATICKLIILTLHGLLLCGATGSPANVDSFTPQYQLVYDSQLDKQYCVPTDQMKRAMDVDFSKIATKLRGASVPIPLIGDECPK